MAARSASGDAARPPHTRWGAAQGGPLVAARESSLSSDDVNSGAAGAGATASEGHGRGRNELHGAVGAGVGATVGGDVGSGDTGSGSGELGSGSGEGSGDLIGSDGAGSGSGSGETGSGSGELGSGSGGDISSGSGTGSGDVIGDVDLGSTATIILRAWTDSSRLTETTDAPWPIVRATPSGCFKLAPGSDSFHIAVCDMASGLVWFRNFADSACTQLTWSSRGEHDPNGTCFSVALSWSHLGTRACRAHP